MGMRALIGALALVSFTAAGRGLGAQTQAMPSVARAGVPSLNAGLLRPGIDRYVVYIVRDGRRELLARVTDEISFAEVAPGDTMVRRVYEYATGEDSYSHLDSVLVDRSDLTLRRYVSHAAGSVSRVEWAEGRLRGEVRVAGKPMAIDAWLNAPVYYAGTLDLVARASLLATGYSGTFSTFSTESGTIAPSELSVTGLDSIGSPQWRVQSEVRGMMTTFWVDRRSHRIIREARYLGKGFQLEIVPVSSVATSSK